MTKQDMRKHLCENGKPICYDDKPDGVVDVTTCVYKATCVDCCDILDERGVTHTPKYAIETTGSARVEVDSTNIKSVGYSGSAKMLEIEFKNGRLYQYEDVGPKTYQTIIELNHKNESVGRFIHKVTTGSKYKEIK